MQIKEAEYQMLTTAIKNVTGHLEQVKHGGPADNQRNDAWCTQGTKIQSTKLPRM